MNSSIVRDVQVAITPTVYEIAALFWDMSYEEQFCLLQRLAKKFNNSHGDMQMHYVAEEATSDDRNDFENVGLFVDKLHEYLGSEALNKLAKQKTEKWKQVRAGEYK